MGIANQARAMRVGTYNNCTIRCSEKNGEGYSVDVWHEGATVTIESTWVHVHFSDGVSRRFLKKTNRSLQIHPNSTLEQARAERADNAARNSMRDETPMHDYTN